MDSDTGASRRANCQERARYISKPSGLPRTSSYPTDAWSRRTHVAFVIFGLAIFAAVVLPRLLMHRADVAP